jgi:hypothetical protein
MEHLYSTVLEVGSGEVGSVNAPEQLNQVTQPSNQATQPSNQAMQLSNQVTQPSNQATQPSNQAMQLSNQFAYSGNGNGSATGIGASSIGTNSTGNVHSLVNQAPPANSSAPAFPGNGQQLSKQGSDDESWNDL